MSLTGSDSFRGTTLSSRRLLIRFLAIRDRVMRRRCTGGAVSASGDEVDLASRSRRFPVAAVDLACGFFQSEDVASCLLEGGRNAAPKQETNVDAQPLTIFMSAELD